MEVPEKPLVWLKGEVKTPPFSSEGRLEAGVLLRRLQKGERLSLPVSRPMPSIGAGCHELRITDEKVTWRIVYFIGSDAIVVLEVFDKRTPATPDRIVENCRRRLSPTRLFEQFESQEVRLVNSAKKKRLESAGWRVGTAKEFLGLSEEEARIVEMKLALSSSLKKHRTRRGWTQLELAKKLGSSQSRVAKLETGAAGATLDLLFRALFATGASTDEIAREMRPRRRSAA